MMGRTSLKTGGCPDTGLERYRLSVQERIVIVNQIIFIFLIALELNLLS